jgi:hypothetical protein
MIKILYLVVFVFFVFATIPGYAQNGSDSVASTDSVGTETTETDSIESRETNPDNINEPVPAGNFLSKEPLREVSQRQVNSYLKNPAYAYANDSDYWKNEPLQKPGILIRLISSRAFMWTLLFLITGVVLYGIFQLARENNFGWLARKPALKTSGRVDPVSDEDIDFDQAILACQAEGNFRMAVRYLYLRLINTAREKSGIRFRDSSTNAEIIQAFGTHPKASEFKWLATAYEYIFYGGFLPKQELYDSLKNKFDALQKILSA